MIKDQSAAEQKINAPERAMRVKKERKGGVSILPRFEVHKRQTEVLDSLEAFGTPCDHGLRTVCSPGEAGWKRRLRL